MGCSNIRTISLISASMQLAGCVTAVFIVLIYCCVVGALANVERFQSLFPHSGEGEDIGKDAAVLAIVTITCGAIPIALLVTVIVGIDQNRVNLVEIYVYVAYVGYGFLVLLIFVTVISAVINQVGAGQIFLILFAQLLYIGYSMLWFTPIYILYRRMISPNYQAALQGNLPLEIENQTETYTCFGFDYGSSGYTLDGFKSFEYIDYNSVQLHPSQCADTP